VAATISGLVSGETDWKAKFVPDVSSAMQVMVLDGLVGSAEQYFVIGEQIILGTDLQVMENFLCLRGREKCTRPEEFDRSLEHQILNPDIVYQHHSQWILFCIKFVRYRQGKYINIKWHGSPRQIFPRYRISYLFPHSPDIYKSPPKCTVKVVPFCTVILPCRI
jgi:hypothetical protein